ncbi:TBC1D19 [Scenedesmus sp. PABB004]|nr:TBC1D19 [Scenedesmus sp. PABB004]
MATCGAISAVLARDERLAQLAGEAEQAVVRARGAAPQRGTVPSAELVATLTASVAFSEREGLAAPSAGGARAPSAPQQQPPDAAAAAVLAAAHRRWQALVLERLTAAQMLLPDVPLAGAPRSARELATLRAQAPDLQHAWERVGSGAFAAGFQVDASAVAKLLYDGEDLLRALTTAEQPAAAGAAEAAVQQPAAAPLSLLQVVRAPARPWLQSFFAELRPSVRQVGADDVLHPWFATQQAQQARQAAASCSAAACRVVARCGVPASERAWVWATALGLHAAPPPERAPPGGEPGGAADGAAAAGARADWWRLPSARDGALLELLCGSVEQQALLTDVLTCADVQRVAECAHFFPFAETMRCAAACALCRWQPTQRAARARARPPPLRRPPPRLAHTPPATPAAAGRAVLLAFSRDGAAAAAAAVPVAPRLAAEHAAPGGGRLLRAYPASGVLPFQGLANYLAPLCFLGLDRPAAVYRLFSALYCRHWCRLHTLNAERAPAAGLAVLAATYLALLQARALREVDPAVAAHLTALGGSALELAFPWIVGAFVGALPPGEVLLLWDRVVGFDSLLPLAVLAAAVMSWRRELVLAAKSADELLDVLDDLGELRVVPLLQAVLFDEA